MMRVTSTVVSIFLIYLGGISNALSQQAVEFNTIPVTSNISMIEEPGGNVGVSIGKDGLMIIDDKFQTTTKELDAAITELGKKSGNGQLKFVLNTHWHGDHSGGNAHFSKRATIIAHENVHKRLSDNIDNPDPRKKVPVEALPVITFSKDMTLHFNGEAIKVIHLPTGHTDGDSVVWFTQSNVMHLGDHFFNGLFPFVDTNSGGSVSGYINNISKVLSLVEPDTKIIPGHGPLASVKDLQESLTMIQETLALVRAKKQQGLSLEDTIKQGLGADFEKFKWKFITEERWITTLYNSLP